VQNCHESLLQAAQVVANLTDQEWALADEKSWKTMLQDLSETVDAIANEVQNAFVPKGDAASSKPVVKSKITLPKEPITSRKLKSIFGQHAETVLVDYLKELPHKGRESRKYKVIEPLPELDEYKELEKKRFTTTVQDLVESAFADFEDLGSEMSDWYENLPESFQDGDKGDALSEARDTLEGLSVPELNEEIRAIPIFYRPNVNIKSRADRRDDAVDRLRAVVGTLEEIEENSDVQAVVDELDNAIDEADSVDFPRMY